MTHSDAECIRRCLNGHRDDYRLLVERYEAPLAALLKGRVRDWHTAQDVAQEAFIRAFGLLGRKRLDEPLFPWLAGISLRVAQEHLRANRPLAIRAPDPTFEAPGSDPVTSVIESDDDELMSAVAELGEPYRDVVFLRYYGGWSCADVAECLGVPLGTITKQLSRAHALLRERLNTTNAREKAEAPR